MNQIMPGGISFDPEKHEKTDDGEGFVEKEAKQRKEAAEIAAKIKDADVDAMELLHKDAKKLEERRVKKEKERKRRESQKQEIIRQLEAGNELSFSDLPGPLQSDDDFVQDVLESPNFNLDKVDYPPNLKNVDVMSKLLEKSDNVVGFYHNSASELKQEKEYALTAIESVSPEDLFRIYREIPYDLLEQNSEVVLKAVDKIPEGKSILNIYKILPENLKEDDRVVSRIKNMVREIPPEDALGIYKSLPDKLLRHNSDIVLELIEKIPQEEDIVDIYEKLPGNLQEHKDIALELVRAGEFSAIREIPDRLFRNTDFLLELMNDDSLSSLLKDSVYRNRIPMEIKKNNKEVVKSAFRAAAKNTGEDHHHYFQDKTPNSIFKDGEFIAEVLEMDAVQQAATEDDHHFVSELLRLVPDEVIESNSRLIEAMIDAGLSSSVKWYMTPSMEDGKRIAKKYVKKDPENLGRIPGDTGWRDDLDVVLVAVRQDPEAIKYASEDIKEQVEELLE